MHWKKISYFAVTFCLHVPTKGYGIMLIKWSFGLVEHYEVQTVQIQHWHTRRDTDKRYLCLCLCPRVKFVLFVPHNTLSCWILYSELEPISKWHEWRSIAMQQLLAKRGMASPFPSTPMLGLFLGCCHRATMYCLVSIPARIVYECWGDMSWGLKEGSCPVVEASIANSEKI